MDLQKEWEKYRDSVYKEGPISAMQDRECRAAFAAGAALMFGEMNAAAGLATEEDGCKRLDELLQAILTERDAVGALLDAAKRKE